MLALVRDGVLTKQRAGFCERGRQGGIDLRLAEGRLPASLGENGHGLAAREMPGADQNALRRNLQGGIHVAGDLPGVHVSRMRDHAAARRDFLFSAGAEVFDLTGEFARVSGVEASGNRRGTDHTVFWHTDSDSGMRSIGDVPKVYCREGLLLNPLIGRQLKATAE